MATEMPRTGSNCTTAYRPRLSGRLVPDGRPEQPAEMVLSAGHGAAGRQVPGRLRFGTSGRRERPFDRQGYLHTSFALDKDGEYLALVAPSGTVVRSMPALPPQQTDSPMGWGRARSAISHPDAGTGQWTGIPRPCGADDPQPPAGILRPAVRAADLLRHAGSSDSLHPGWLGADGTARHPVQSEAHDSYHDDDACAVCRLPDRLEAPAPHPYLHLRQRCRPPAGPSSRLAERLGLRFRGQRHRPGRLCDGPAHRQQHTARLLRPRSSPRYPDGVDLDAPG